MESETTAQTLASWYEGFEQFPTNRMGSVRVLVAQTESDLEAANDVIDRASADWAATGGGDVRVVNLGGAPRPRPYIYYLVDTEDQAFALRATSDGAGGSIKSWVLVAPSEQEEWSVFGTQGELTQLGRSVEIVDLRIGSRPTPSVRLAPLNHP